MEADHLDQGPDLRLRPPDAESTTLRTQALGEDREIHDQRRVGEDELRHVDHHVTRRLQCAREGAAPPPRGGPVLVTGYEEDGFLCIEGNDARESTRFR